MNTPETKLVAVDGREALMYVLVLPHPDGVPGHVVVDAGAAGMDKAQGVTVLRHVADMWEAEIREAEAHDG